MARRGVGLPPPYRIMRPVRVKSCLATPFFSIACWAIISPVAKRIAVVTLCVVSGRVASFNLYLWVLLPSVRFWQQHDDAANSPSKHVDVYFPTQEQSLNGWRKKVQYVFVRFNYVVRPLFGCSNCRYAVVALSLSGDISKARPVRSSLHRSFCQSPTFG